MIGWCLVTLEHSYNGVEIESELKFNVRHETPNEEYAPTTLEPVLSQVMLPVPYCRFMGSTVCVVPGSRAHGWMPIESRRQPAPGSARPGSPVGPQCDPCTKRDLKAPIASLCYPPP